MESETSYIKGQTNRLNEWLPTGEELTHVENLLISQAIM